MFHVYRPSYYRELDDFIKALRDGDMEAITTLYKLMLPILCAFAHLD